jgi:peptide/nickel transport system permease protein
MAVAMVMAIVGGALLGIASALRVRGSSALRLLMVSGAAAPSFLLGLLGVIIFYKHLGWLPATGRSNSRGSSGPTNFLLIDTIIHGDFSGLVDAAKHLVMPAFCLAVGPAVAIGRVLRGSLMTTLRADFIATARAKGLREVAVIGRHGLRNAAAAPIQMTGLQIGFMFASVVIVEQIFSWPGVGSYMSQALVNSDFPAVVGVSLLAGTLFVVLNALVDIIQTVADRRVALG